MKPTKVLSLQYSEDENRKLRILIITTILYLSIVVSVCTFQPDRCQKKTDSVVTTTTRQEEVSVLETYTTLVVTDTTVDVRPTEEMKTEQPSVEDSGFRSWMSYRRITSLSSPQYRVVSMSRTNSEGLREIDGRVLVAIGTGWGLNVGDTATICTDKSSYEVVIGDIKSDSHTDSTNKVTKVNGCVVEFIVDSPKLPDCVKVSGTISSIPKYAGIVTDIVKTGSVLY